MIRRSGRFLVVDLQTPHRVHSTSVKIPIDRIDHAVLKTLAGDVLRPAVVMAIVDGVLARLEPRAAARAVGQQRTALQAVEREIGYLVKAIATGDPLEPLLEGEAAVGRLLAGTAGLTT